MTPGSSTVASLDFQDAALAVGRTFSDAASGVTISLVAADASGVAIDVGVPTGGSPTPSCTRAAPAITLAGPAAAVAAGTTVGYTVTLLNQDSSACPSTSFSLAETVPTGWSSAMGTRSISISAGSSASTTLSITSPAGATAAGYGIGVGAGSAVGSAHTSSAATTYTVAAASFALSNSVGTDKVSYLRGETVNASARVMSNGVPVAGAEVRFTLAKPDGSNAGFTVSSGSDGYARMTFKPGKSKSAIGNYTLKADASRNGASASATSAFSVR